MKVKLLTVVFVFIALLSVTFTAKGNITLESVLVKINSSARSDFGLFRTQISLNFNIPEKRVDYYYTSLRMVPADIYMVAQLSIISRAPVERVVEVYRVNKSKGWGYIARQLGIKPGSKEFMRLKDKANDFHGKIKHKKKENKNSKGK